MLAEVDIFDSQAQAFEQAQAGAVEEFGLEAEGWVGDMFEDVLDFGFGEDDGQAFVFLGAQGLDAGELNVEDLSIEEEDGLHRHVLGAGGDVVDDGEVRQEGCDVIGAQVARMAVGALGRLVEMDVAGDPVDVGLFGAVGVVFGAQDVAHLVEQFGFGHRFSIQFQPERSLLMRLLAHCGRDYTSDLREFQIMDADLRLNN